MTPLARMLTQSDWFWNLAARIAGPFYLLGLALWWVTVGEYEKKHDHAYWMKWHQW